MSASTVVIVNPAARGGRVGERWSELEPALTRALGTPLTFLHTAARGDASVLARQAVEAGARTLLSLGGDGTHNEVVCGIMRSGAAPGSIRLGILPAGTGGDFRRVLSSSADLMSAARALRAPLRERIIDVGLVRFTNHRGEADARHFLNLASFGITGLIDSYVNRSRKRCGGTLAFLTASIRAFFAFSPNRVSLTLDGEPLPDTTITAVLVANSRFAGGGMCFAPEALLDDGLLDIILLHPPPLHRAPGLLAQLYRGTHTSSPWCSVHRGRNLEARVLDGTTAWIDCDGEDPGVLPASFHVVPRAHPPQPLA